MGIKISRGTIVYILLIVIVIFCIYELIFVHLGETDRGPIPVPVDPIRGYWNQTGDKIFYGFGADSVYKGYGNHTNYSPSRGYWTKLNETAYILHWPDSANETIMYDPSMDRFTTNTGIYIRAP